MIGKLCRGIIVAGYSPKYIHLFLVKILVEAEIKLLPDMSPFLSVLHRATFSSFRADISKLELADSNPQS